MNSPARVLQEASFNDGGLGADANSDNALSVARCVNGECHGNPISNTHTRIRVDSGRRYGAGPHQSDGAAATHNAAQAEYPRLAALQQPLGTETFRQGQSVH